MTDRIGASYSSPATSFYLAADHIASDNVNGRWLVRFYLRAVNGPGGSTGSQYNGAGAQVGYYNGNEFGRHSGNPFLPSGVPNGGTRWNDGPWDIWVNGRSAWNMPLSMLAQYGNVNSWSGGSIYLPTLASAPSNPGTPTYSEVAPTSMRVSWVLPYDGGSPLDAMLLRQSADPNFSSYTDIILAGNATTTLVEGLTPATTYYFRIFARNAVGYSNYSSSSQATVPATAPGMSVMPSISGTNATVSLTPPGGATGVTKYAVERRRFGTTAPVTSVENATSPILITGLTPGVSYEYRARAFFGAYESPWTAWGAYVQPNPNTDPGGYFDGSTPSTPALTYAWGGTVGKSISTASGLIPTGWRTFAQSATVSGGGGQAFRAAGGFAGSFAARAVFFTDATAYGFAFGTADSPVGTRAAVEAGATYFGSIYVWPSKVKQLRAVVRWYNAAGTFLSSTPGVSQLAAAGVFTRLSASGAAPATAASASIVVEDVAATGTALWQGGDWLHLDAAMVSLQQLFPYFDGNTADADGFAYEWLGAENASASMRTSVPGTGVDPLLDPDCPPIPGAPQPPPIDDTCIDEVGTWRRYWAVIPESEVFDWLSVVPTTRITTGAYAARQVRVRYYPNPDGLVPEQALDLPPESEQIITYMPPDTVFTLDGVSESAWASVSGGEDRPTEHLLRGTNNAPPVWPVLSCGGSYLISFDVPLDAPEGNISVGVSLTTRMT